MYSIITRRMCSCRVRYQCTPILRTLVKNMLLIKQALYVRTVCTNILYKYAVNKNYVQCTGLQQSVQNLLLISCSNLQWKMVISKPLSKTIRHVLAKGLRRAYVLLKSERKEFSHLTLIHLIEGSRSCCINILGW